MVQDGATFPIVYEFDDEYLANVGCMLQSKNDKELI